MRKRGCCRRRLTYLRGFIILLAFIVFFNLPMPAYAHSGAPFPLWLDEPVGPYRLTVWTDPDVGKGTFIVVVEHADGMPLSPSTSVTLSAEPIDGHTVAREFPAQITQGQKGPEFKVTVPFDQEGTWNVTIFIRGAAGDAQVARKVDVTATGSSLWSVLLWTAPFIGLALLWAYAVLRSRNNVTPPSSSAASST